MMYPDTRTPHERAMDDALDRAAEHFYCEQPPQSISQALVTALCLSAFLGLMLFCVVEFFTPDRMHEPPVEIGGLP